MVLAACSGAKEQDLPLEQITEESNGKTESPSDETNTTPETTPAETGKPDEVSEPIEILVRDVDGNPVSAVYIQLCNGDICATVKTDEEGKASFTGTEESYEADIYRAPEGLVYSDGKKVVVPGDHLEMTLNREAAAEPDPAVPVDPADPSVPDEPADPSIPDEPIGLGDIDEAYKIEFSSVKYDGGYISSETFADYKLTFINRWEPWCGPCVSEMADIQALYEKYEPLGVNFIGVYADEDGFDDVIEYTGAKYTMVKDTIGFSKISNLGYVPVTCIVDSQGYMLPMLDIADSLTGEFDSGDPLYERTHIGSLPGSSYEAVIKHYLGL